MSILFQRSFAAVATGVVMLASAQSHADSVLPPGYAPYPGYALGSAPYVPPVAGTAYGYVPYQPLPQIQRPPPGLFGRLPQTPNCLGCGFGLRLQQQVRPGYIGFGGRLPGH
jgi:hypothetical protein